VAQSKYPYPTSCAAQLSEQGKEYFPRCDSQISHAELKDISTIDPDRWFVEWTYRIFEMLENIDNPRDFMEGLLMQYLSAKGIEKRSDYRFQRFTRGNNIELIELSIGQFVSGNRSLLHTCTGVRAGLAGYYFEAVNNVKIEPYLREAYLTVLNNLKGKQ
jgi:hypothetical protein